MLNNIKLIFKENQVEMALGSIWGFIAILVGPLVGAFTGVYLSFRKNNKRQEEIDYEKKLLLLKILRHGVKRGIELLKEPSGNLIPMDAWNSIIYSGNIVLFDHSQAADLGDIYFDIQNYNYEAKRTRDASEHFHSLPEPLTALNPSLIALSGRNEHWQKAKDRWESLSINLSETTAKLRGVLLDLEKADWFDEK